MAPKKLHAAATAYKVPSQLQIGGLRSLRSIEKVEHSPFRTTKAGRQVVLTFGKSERTRGTTIYLDDIKTVIHRQERRVYTVKTIAEKTAGKRTASKKSALAAKTKFVTLNGEIRGNHFEASGTEGSLERIEASAETLQAKRPIIPPSIKKFTLYFFNNIRKLICPKKGTKVTLSTGATATINGVATWIMGHFLLAGAVANALASAVILLIVTATKGTFCDMTADLAKDLIKKA